MIVSLQIFALVNVFVSFGCKLEVMLYVVYSEAIHNNSLRASNKRFLSIVLSINSFLLLILQQRTIPSVMGKRPFSTTEVAKSSGGAGFFARVGSFLVGAGLTALVTEIYIFKEVREGNLEMLKRQRELEKRIAALEKKK